MNKSKISVFSSKLKSQLIFATIHDHTTLFVIIHESHCTISANFNLYL